MVIFSTSKYFVVRWLHCLIPLLLFSADGKVSQYNHGIIRKWRLLRRLGKQKKRLIKEQKSAYKAKRKEERRWNRYRFRRKLRWFFKHAFKRKVKKDRSDTERKKAWAEEKRWRKEERHWRMVKRRRIFRLVVKNAFKKRPPKQKPAKAVAEESFPIVEEPLIKRTVEEIVTPEEMRAIEKEERRWRRYKRRRILRYIIKKTIIATFTKKTEEQKAKISAKKAAKRAEKRWEKEKKRRMFRFVMRKRKKAIKNFFKDFPAEPMRQLNEVFYEAKIGRPQFIAIIINSTFYFIVSYLVFQLLQYLITSLFALHFGYQTIWYYWMLYFNVSADSWSFDSVKILYSVPTLLALATGLLLAILYSSIKQEKGHFKMFVMWSIFHCFVIFGGDLLLGPVFEQGFGYVIMYLYFLDTKRMIMVIVALFILITSGVLMARMFMLSANIYVTELTKHNRKIFMVAQVLIPFFLGSFAIIWMKLPEVIFYEVFLMSTGVLVIIPIMSVFTSFNEIYFDFERPRIRLFKKMLLVSVIFIILWRFATEIGIKFGVSSADTVIY